MVAELEKTSRSHPWRTGKLDAAAPPDGGLSGFKLGGRTTPPPKPFGTGTVKDTPPKPSGGLFGQAAAAAAPNPSVGHRRSAAPSHGFGQAAPNPFAAVAVRRAARAGARRRRPLRFSAAAAPSPRRRPRASPSPFAGFSAATAAPAAAPAERPFQFHGIEPTSPTAAAAPALPAPSFTSSHPTSPRVARAGDDAPRAAAAAASLAQLRTCAPPALVRYLVAARLAPDEPSVARVRIESSGGAGGASVRAGYGNRLDDKKAAVPNLLRVTGADSRCSNTLSGDYQKSGTRNGRPCGRKRNSASNTAFSAPPVLAAAVSTGMAPPGRLPDGNGMTENGWTQQVDTHAADGGLELRAVSEMSRIYDDLRVEAITNGKGAFATSAADGGSGSGGTDRGELRRRGIGRRSRRSARRRARRFGQGRRRRRVHVSSACARLGTQVGSQMYSDGGEKGRRAPKSAAEGAAARETPPSRVGTLELMTRRRLVPATSSRRSSPLPLWAAHVQAERDAGRHQR